jgi:hypothetical protein
MNGLSKVEKGRLREILVNMFYNSGTHYVIYSPSKNKLYIVQEAGPVSRSGKPAAVTSGRSVLCKDGYLIGEL